MIKNRTKLVPWILAAFVLLIYLSFPTRNYYWDGISFAQTIEDAQGLHPSLIHPSHLIYNVVGYLFYRVIRLVGIDIRALTALQLMSSVLSAMCAFVLFHILRSAFRSIYICSTLTLLFAFSATWWKFSTDADAYIPAVLFLIISFYLILPLRRPRPLLVALTFAVSIAFHQLAVVFFPVLIVGLFLQTPSLPLRQRIITILQFGIAAFVITISAYYCGFYLASRSFGFTSFVRWMTYHSSESSFSFNLWSNLRFTLRGQARLIFGGRFTLIKGLINPVVAMMMVIMVVLFLFLGFSLVRSFKKGFFSRRRFTLVDQNSKRLLLLCVLWISVFNIFLFFWLPFNTFYRLFYLPALILLAGLLISAPSREATKPARTYRAATIVALVALANFLFVIFPYSHAQKFPPVSLAQEMTKTWRPGTVIYYAQANSDNSLFRYLNPTTVWKQIDATEANLRETELQNTYRQGNAAWLEVSAIEQFSSSPEGADWLSAHAVKESLREIKDPAYKIKFIQVVPR